MKKVTLNRVIGLPYLILYGLGNIIGAGIYILIGEISGISGYLTPLAFLTACIGVLFSALSYAELSSRYPKSAAEAYFLQKGFNNRLIADISGFVIILSGLFSAAAIISGLYGYLQPFVDIGEFATSFVIISILTFIAIWGIKQSVGLAALFTLIEILGILLIIVVGFYYLDLSKIDYSQYIPSKITDINFILLGSFLAFYAFIGFEDVVKLSEETINPSKTMPKAIIITLLLVTFLYVAVSFVAVSVVDPKTLASSKEPLALVYQELQGDSKILNYIAIFAIVNGALVQIIMVSRMFYGMAKEGWLPQFLAYVNPTTKTPIYATVLTAILLSVLVLFLDLVKLAEFTSYGLLSVFLLINVALLRIKSKEKAPKEAYVVPYWVPAVAIIINVIFLVVKIMDNVK